MWKSSYAMWQDHKFLGVGLANWQKEYATHYILKDEIRQEILQRYLDGKKAASQRAAAAKKATEAKKAAEQKKAAERKKTVVKNAPAKKPVAQKPAVQKPKPQLTQEQKAAAAKAAAQKAEAAKKPLQREKRTASRHGKKLRLKMNLHLICLIM